MPEGDADFLHWPTAFPRIKANRHRRAGAERGEDETVRRWTGICPTEGNRLVRREVVRPDLNFLSEALRVTVNDYVRFCFFGQLTFLSSVRALPLTDARR